MSKLKGKLLFDEGNKTRNKIYVHCDLFLEQDLFSVLCTSSV